MNITKHAASLALSVLRPSTETNAWYQQIAWTLFRVVLGGMMIHNGFDKLADIEGFAIAYVQVIGLPFPVFFAHCAAYAEVAGSILLMLGMMTRPAALALAGTMVVAMYHHVLVAGFNLPYLELSAVYFSAFTFFVANGSGVFAGDRWVSQWLASAAGLDLQQTVASLESSFQASTTAEESEKAAV